MLNKKVANLFYEMAKILEILGENPFRVRAYEKAARRIEELNEDLMYYIESDKLESIPGIGKDLAQKIKEIAETGTLTQYEELKKRVPRTLLEMLNIPGLGAKKIKLIYEELGIDSIEQLEQAARKGLLRKLTGFGEKTEENILKGIEFLKRNKGRWPLVEALKIALELFSYLERSDSIVKADIVGSIRRFKETVHDVDILAIADNEDKVMTHFINYPYVERVLAKGVKRSSVIVDGLQIDLRVFDTKSYGAALMYFTGSKQHNVKLRQVCIDKGYKLNEYGLFKGNLYIAGESEKEVYSKLGMEWIPPEIREDTGEIELALSHELPILIKRQDIKGDLHLHSSYSDGNASIQEIIEKAVSLGYEYIAITDHSPSLSVAGGLSRDRILSQMEEIRAITSSFEKISVFCGLEVDILANGDLDCPDDILDLLDMVVVAVHSRFNMSLSAMTKRILKALKHPKVNIFAHPTGRLLGERDAYALDIQEVLAVAKEYNVALELNSSPRRLDIDSRLCKLAKSMGVKVAINTDAHSVGQMEYINFGVGVARRGWLERKDVVNTMSKEELRSFLKKS